MKNYAYIGKGNILHIVADETDAKKHSKNGNVIATTFPCENGYPVLKGERKVYCYGIGRAYWNNREIKGDEIPLQSYHELLEVYILYRDLQ